jgi:putative transposase
LAWRRTALGTMAVAVAIGSILPKLAQRPNEPCGARLLDLASAGCRVGDHRRVIFPVVCLVARCLLRCVMVRGRREVSEDAGLLVLRHENAVLRGQVGRARSRPGGRLWRAALSRLIPRRSRAEVFAVGPAALLGWHRRLVAGRRDEARRRRPGRPSAAAAIRTLVIGMAVDNPARGPRRGHGELITPGRQIAASAVGPIRPGAGIHPAPGRPGRPGGRS